MEQSCFRPVQSQSPWLTDAAAWRAATGGSVGAALRLSERMSPADRRRWLQQTVDLAGLTGNRSRFVLSDGMSPLSFDD